MGQLTQDGDLRVSGNASFGTVSLPSASVADANVKSDANIAHTKSEQRRQVVYSQVRATANVAERKYVARVYAVGGGTLLDFRAVNGVAAASTDSTTVDLYLNGSSILSATLTLNAAAGTTMQVASFSATTLAQGDLLEVVVTVSGSSKGNEVAAFLTYKEAGT